MMRSPNTSRKIFENNDYYVAIVTSNIKELAGRYGHNVIWIVPGVRCRIEDDLGRLVCTLNAINPLGMMTLQISHKNPK